MEEGVLMATLLNLTAEYFRTVMGSWFHANAFDLVAGGVDALIALADEITAMT